MLNNNLMLATLLSIKIPFFLIGILLIIGILFSILAKILSLIFFPSYTIRIIHTIFSKNNF